MCLSIPAKIISIEGENALVSISGMRMNASLSLLSNAKPGDFVLIHSGFAIEIIDREEAEKTLEIVRHIRPIK